MGGGRPRMTDREVGMRGEGRRCRDKAAGWCGGGAGNAGMARFSRLRAGFWAFSMREERFVPREIFGGPQRNGFGRSKLISDKRCQMSNNVAQIRANPFDK